MATFADQLRSALPELRILDDAVDMEGYRFDETAFLHAGRPAAVCFPRSTEDVVAIVQAAAAAGVPIVPRGAGTGLSGGAVAIDGCVTVVFTDMNAILEIDPANLTATLQPGVINADLNKAVAEHGLVYPPDPASFETCTIGGNLAENSGGLRCVKYGVTRDWVMGLEVVLADGSVIRTGGKNKKDVAGYDLTGVFVGSEGTLGLITQATVRLLPKRPANLTMLAFFDSIHGAGQGVANITASGIMPVTLELMDAFTIAAVDDAFKLGLDRDGCGDAHGRVGSGRRGRGRRAGDCPGGVPRRRGDICPRLGRYAARPTGCARHGAAPTAHSSEPAPRAWTTWACRARAYRRCSIASPRSPRVTSCRWASSAMPATATCTRRIVLDRDDPDAERKIDAARDEIYRAALELGGTVTGEHGTGLAKKRWLELQRGARAVEVMRSIKKALDPDNLLNPGKVF